MKIRVGVIWGGMSVEHEVSVISGLQAYHALDSDKYEAVPIYISKQGEWYTGLQLTDMDNYKDMSQLLKEVKRVVLYTNEAGKHQLISPGPARLFKSNVMSELDVAFPVTHGTYGEDGALQGLLEMNRIPYVGCDVLSAANGMDKIAMKTIIRGAGLPVTDFHWFYSQSWFDDQAKQVEKIEQKLGYPVIVKPANLGSSVGIAKAKNRDELIDAVEEALTYAPKILAEHMVSSLTEVNCSVLGDYEEMQASECEEVLKSSDILSYQDKYMNQGSKGMSGGENRRIPAGISDELTERIKDLACQTFLELGCAGVSRIDFLIDRDRDAVYINEINSIPGSLAFYLWEATGVSFTELTERLVQVALKRSRERSNLTFTYDTNLLAMHSKGGKLGTKK